MKSPSYITLSRQTALVRQLDMVAHNIANMNTTGYKAQSMLFTEFLEKPAPGERLSFVEDRNTMRDLGEGPLAETNNPLDLALQGNGYFAVQTVNGPRYTRAGRFQLDANRQIVDGNGLPVLDDAGRPIIIPTGASDIGVTGDGSITTDQGTLARLQVVRFDQEQFMDELGGGLYATAETPQAAPQTKVVQGMIESSNVQPIVEMTRMIEINRQYQTNQRLLEAEGDRQRNAIDKLARVN